MFHKLFSIFSYIPNFYGKLFLLDSFYRAFLRGNEFLTTTTWKGVKLSLFMKDRIQRRIFIKKCHEFETEVQLLKLAEGASGFIDIGANIGYFGLMIAHNFPQIPIYAFEPNLNNLKRIAFNQKLNAITNIKVCNVCISNLSEEVEFALPPLHESGWGHISSPNYQEDNFTKITSQAETLDNLLSKGFFEDNKPSLIKIDIEGSEEKALLGAREFIKKIRPIMCIELNESCLLAHNSSPLKVMNLLQSWGYDAFFISNDQLKPTNIPVKNYHFLDYFFLPQKS